MERQHLFVDHVINKTCCSIINRLQTSLNCFSSPINDIRELVNGIVLIELIELFEDVVLIQAPRSFGNKIFNDNREPLKRNAQTNNIEFIEQWFKREGMQLNGTHFIKELFAELQHSEEKLVQYNLEDLQKTPDLDFLVGHLEGTTYARSIAYLAVLCYSLITIFLRNDSIFRRLVNGYNFQINQDELLHILFYTKWKLTEEELLLKDLNIMRLQDQCDLMQLQLNTILKSNIELSQNELNNDSIQQKSCINSPIEWKINHSNKWVKNSVISSIDQLVNEETLTEVNGHSDVPVCLDFNLIPINNRLSDERSELNFLTVQCQGKDKTNKELSESLVHHQNISVLNLNENKGQNTSIKSTNHPPKSSNFQSFLSNKNGSYENGISNFDNRKNIELEGRKFLLGDDQNNNNVNNDPIDFDLNKLHLEMALRFGNNHLMLLPSIPRQPNMKIMLDRKTIGKNTFSQLNKEKGECSKQEQKQREKKFAMNKPIYSTKFSSLSLITSSLMEPSHLTDVSTGTSETLGTRLGSECQDIQHWTQSDELKAVVKHPMPSSEGSQLQSKVNSDCLNSVGLLNSNKTILKQNLEKSRCASFLKKSKSNLTNIRNQELKNRILIARLLAELSYERRKNMKCQSIQSTLSSSAYLKQTNIDYL